jgi:hypothetical protein
MPLDKNRQLKMRGLLIESSAGEIVPRQVESRLCQNCDVSEINRLFRLEADSTAITLCHQEPA